jgi:hypothetical protein
MIFNTKNYVGIRRTRRIHAVEALQFERSSGSNTPTAVNTTTKTTPAVVPLTAIVNSVEEIAVKTAVKCLLSPNPAFHTWLQHLIMPKPIKTTTNTYPSESTAYI